MAFIHFWHFYSFVSIIAIMLKCLFRFNEGIFFAFYPELYGTLGGSGSIVGARVTQIESIEV